MQDNNALYRLGLSGAGGAITALLGLLLGAVWSVALDVDLVTAALITGALGFVWGAISYQLTPTGGVIMENRTPSSRRTRTSRRFFVSWRWWRLLFASLCSVNA
jgi:hypothetical protein